MQLKLSKQQSASSLKPREKKSNEQLNQPHIYPIDNYKLPELINIGGYGCVYKAFEVKTNNQVAIKYSKQNMQQEYEIMQLLQKCIGIPKVYSFGKLNNTYYLIMEILTEDIQSIITKQKYFTPKTILLIAIKIMQVLDEIHKRGIKHRDIKPQNLMVKFQDQNIYLIDFGISIFHNDQQQENYVEGTILYDSRTVHKRQKYRFIDDVEMLGYCLVELLQGQLQWRKYIDGKESRILQMKQQFIDSQSLKQLSIYPLFKFIELNQIDDVPDYALLISQLKQQLINENFVEDYKYDWLDIIEQQYNAQKSRSRGQSLKSQISKFAPEILDQNIAPEGQIQFVNDQLYKFMQ